MVHDLPKYQVKKKHETNNRFIYANCFSPWHGTSGSWIRCFASCLFGCGGFHGGVGVKRWCFVEPLFQTKIDKKQNANQKKQTHLPRRLFKVCLDYQKFAPRWQVYCLDRKDLACGKAWGEEPTRHWRPLIRLPR